MSVMQPSARHRICRGDGGVGLRGVEWGGVGLRGVEWGGVGLRGVE